MKLNTFLIAAAVVLLGVAGYMFLEEGTSSTSPIMMKFEDQQGLQQLKSGVENRLPLSVINPTKQPARIVGNNAC